MKIESKAAKPADVKRVLEGIACMWEVPVDEVEAQIASNFKGLCAVFGIRIEDAHS